MASLVGPSLILYGFNTLCLLLGLYVVNPLHFAGLALLELLRSIFKASGM